MKERVLTINGIGNLSIPPDEINIKVEIETLDTTYNKAIEKQRKKISNLTQSITRSGLKSDQVKSGSYTIQRKSEYKNSSYVFVGFEVSQTIKITLDLDNKLLNKILEEMSSNLIQGEIKISYSISDIQAFKNALLEDAIQNAKSKASVIAKASGIQLKEIIDINYSWSELRVTSYRKDQIYCEESSYSAPSIPDFEPEEVSESETVRVTWRIE